MIQVKGFRKINSIKRSQFPVIPLHTMREESPAKMSPTLSKFVDPFGGPLTTKTEDNGKTPEMMNKAKGNRIKVVKRTNAKNFTLPDHREKFMKQAESSGKRINISPSHLSRFLERNGKNRHSGVARPNLAQYEIGKRTNRLLIDG